jgi:photosystem II stability/assembly factor-like uncharacterized protein
MRKRVLSSVLAVVMLAVITTFATSPVFGASGASGAGAAKTVRTLDPDLLAGMKARSIGPAGMSGRVAAIDAVESNPDIIYVGAASGGVWKSTDAGLTWEPIFDDQPVASIGAIAIYQANPDIVWVGTGEANTRNSVSVGDGVYRSIDGGKTWTHVGLEKSEHIYRIVLHPTDPNVAWVSALGRLWGENPERGIYKTEDGGKTWNLVLKADDKTGGGDIAIDPRNPDKLFASLWQVRRWPWSFQSGGPGSGLFVTYDGGKNWKSITEDDGLPSGNLGKIAVAISRSNPETVYTLVEADKSALLRSDDGGKHWQTVNTRYDVNPRPFYFGDLKVDPAWPNRVYSVDYDIRVSNDGGKSFQTGVSGGEIHGDFHALWIDPHDPTNLIVGGDGGLGISHDRGRTSRAVPNLPIGQFYHVAVDMDTPYNVYGGMQDNSSWRGPSSVWVGGGIRNQLWQSLVGGDGFETLPDTADSMVGYSLWQGGNLVRYNLHTAEYRDIKPAPPAGTKLRFNWNAGLATDPFTPGTIYLGSQFLHESTDRGETWKIISPDLTSNNPEWQKQSESGGLTRDVTSAENFTTIITIAPSPKQQGAIWVGTDDGRVQLTRDGGKTWESVEKNVKGVPALPANTWVPAIHPSNHDAATAFAVFDNHRRSDWTPYVYRTDDWGKSWRSLATPELRGYAKSIVQDPVDQDLLFLGTEFGLWVSTDGGKRWMKWTHGLPTVAVDDLAIQPRDGDLAIATHGRALYILDDIQPLRELSDDVLRQPVHLFRIPDAQQHAWAPEPGGFALGAEEFRGENRDYGAVLDYWLSDPKLPLPIAEKERARKEKERQEKREAEAKATVKPVEHVVEHEESPGPAQEKVAEQEKKGNPKETPEKGTDEKKEKETPKEVEIRVADATGKVIRTFTAPAVQGLNRTYWGLRRDAFKGFPGEEPPPPHPAGPEVMPGTYEVTVRYNDQESKQTVRVLADPRYPVTAEGLQQHEDALVQTGEIQNAISESIDRIRKTRADVQDVLARHDQRKKEEREAKGETTPPPSAKDEKPDALTEAGQKLQKGLTDLEKKLWTPYDTPGIVADDDLLSQLFYVRGYIQSSWAPPTPNHMEFLRQFAARTATVVADVNKYFDTDVAAFRKQVDEEGLRLLGPVPPIRIGKGQ